MGPRVRTFITWVVVIAVLLIAGGLQKAADLHSTPPAPAVTTPAGHR
ncbi:MAG TPA: hypothetical protein VMT30_00630 [Candidatus Saccharimonadia bacterium]|nr:hypothetical protein [Candidatus Saccharimonadia bacterium]